MTMQIEERIYYEEEQKMEANWILIFILISSISSMAIAVAFLYKDDPDWLQIGIVAGAIILSDIFIIVLFKTMKLELSLSKKGIHYKMTYGSFKHQLVAWDEVDAISIRKCPVSGYGKQRKWKYGDVYAMNLQLGVELLLKNGKKKYFSLKQPDEFKKAFNKLELTMHIL